MRGRFGLFVLLYLINITTSATNIDAVTFNLEHPRYGHVLVTKHGYERYLCVNGYFSFSEANVVCRDMGFTSGQQLPSEEVPMSQQPSWWKNTFSCGGQEPRLSACARSTWESHTPPYSDSNVCAFNTPSVFCYGKARLHTPLRNTSGVIGLYHEDSYYAICADNFGQAEVFVLCTSIGFNGGQLVPSNSYQNPYYLRIVNVSCSGSEKNLDQCSYEYNESPSCGGGPATVVCIDVNNPESNLPDGSIKLDRDARVLMKKHKIWGTICYDGWDDVDARIACQQLGFENGRSLQLSRNIYLPKWYKNTSCRGNETSLDECPKDDDTSYCYYTFDSGAYCYNNSDVPTFSLVGGNSSHYGRVQITRGDTTHFLCDTSGYFNFNEMEFVCKQLGFIRGQEYVDLKGEMPYGTTFWSNNIDCKTEVPFIDACTTGIWKEETYDPMGARVCGYNVPSIYCYGDVRLESDFHNSSGRVKVNKDSNYNYVCSTNFTSTEINVICSQLDFHDGGRNLPLHSYKVFYTGFGNIVNGYTCTGSESSLTDCSYYDATPCDQPATIACYESYADKIMATGSVKMSDDDVVLMSVDGVWGTICGAGWSDEAAMVICREQGYKMGIPIIKDERYRKPMLTMSVNCTGTENKLAECSRETTDGSECKNNKRAGLHCYTKTVVNHYSLAHGDGYRYGRLMVTRNNKTGYVCSRNFYFDYTDANVLCKQLGFSSGERYDMPALQAEPGTRFWSNDIDCSNNEPTIDACVKGQWSEITYQVNSNTCPYHIPTVFCYGQVRLHTKYRNTTGAVLVYDNNKYKTICADGFDTNAVNVVCKELGFNITGRLLPGNNFNVHSNMLNTGYTCTGSESRLADCMTQTGNISCNYGNIVTISCGDGNYTHPKYNVTYPQNNNMSYPYYTTSTPQNTSFSASTNNTAWDSNRLVLIRVNGVWGGVCSEGWNDTDADVFCKELGFEKGLALILYGYTSNLPLLRYNIQCNGTEKRFMDCPYDSIDNSNGSCSTYAPDARAFCYNTNNLKQYRLTGGSRLNRGYVEVLHDNTWHQLCDTYGFYNTKSNIICRQLGYERGELYHSDNLNNMNESYWRTSMSCQGTEPMLDFCIQKSGWEVETNPYSSCNYDSKSVYCYGTVRLHTKYDNSTGAVLVYDGNSYKILCSDHFDSNTAAVVCRELGFLQGGTILPVSSFRAYYGSLGKTYACTGTENRLSDCSIHSSTCSSRENIAIVSCVDGTVVQGNNGDVMMDSTGLVLTLYHGIWGTVCSDDWDDEDAQVACRDSGYQYGQAYQKYLRDPSRPLWIYEIDCVGTEKKLSLCPSTQNGVNYTCLYSASAMAYCYNDSNAISYSITGGDGNYGYVQANREGQLGYICDAYQYSNEAETACKSLGFSTGDDYPMPELNTSVSYWEGQFSCPQSPPALHLCENTYWSFLSANNHSYHYDSCRSNILSVYCYGKVRLHSKFRNSSGIVLGTHGGESYAYCVDGFNINTANAICMQLGFISANLIISSSVYRHMNYYGIGFRNVVCISGAQSLDECTSEFATHSTCIGGAAAVACDDGNPPISDGLTRILKDGTIQISKHGIWGTIDGRDWTDVDAEVVCRENGFETGKAIVKYYLPYPRWMFNVGCSGSERKLFDCPYDVRPANESEAYYGDAAAYCYNTSQVNSSYTSNATSTSNTTNGNMTDSGYSTSVQSGGASTTPRQSGSQTTTSDKTGSRTTTSDKTGIQTTTSDKTGGRTTTSVKTGSKTTTSEKPEFKQQRLTKQEAEQQLLPKQVVKQQRRPLIPTTQIHKRQV